jgi:ubiquinone/menaquinone biosynthesis C-methylase UbiE
VFKPTSFRFGLTQKIYQKEIMTTYNWNAKDYERNSQAQQKWARELIANLNLRREEDILDLGCGDGRGAESEK